MKIAVVGAGAFGTALAITLAQEHRVVLWGRDQAQVKIMQQARENQSRLPGHRLPESIHPTANLDDLRDQNIILLSVPMQKLRSFLESAGDVFDNKILVSCCKGIELSTGCGPCDIISDLTRRSKVALLTGPSFAQDIAQGLPTALTLACTDETLGSELQEILSADTLRLYTTTDVIGASLGGALKNVIAIACGAAMGAGLGESARAALMTRGNAEMQRYAVSKGGSAETLSGLSGFGDLVLTCTSDLSRNYRLGLSIGGKTDFDPQTTVEGAATARAITAEAERAGLDMPISRTVAALVENRMDVQSAMAALLSRSLKEE